MKPTAASAGQWRAEKAEGGRVEEKKPHVDDDVEADQEDGAAGSKSHAERKEESEGRKS